MKFVAFNGSPSGKASTTGRIIKAFLAGYEFAADGAVSKETLAQLDRPLMSTPNYVKFLGMQ